MITKQSMIICCGLTFLFLTVLMGTVAAQMPVEEWDNKFGGENGDMALSVEQTSDGGYILAGETESFGAGSYDAWLIKTDSNGAEIWNKTFGGEDYDVALSVEQTSDGGYIMAGWTRSVGAGSYDAWLIKTDSDGTEMWNKTVGEIGYMALSVEQTSDGGYILAGETESFGAGEADAWLIKTDSNGTEMWNKTFGGENFDTVRSVEQTSDGGYILAGVTESFGAGAWDSWLIKTDSDGTEMWNKTFGGENGDLALSVEQTSDSGYILAGYTNSSGSGEDDAWLIKTDSNGTEIWNKTFGGVNNDTAWSVEQASDSGYILAGETESFGAGSADAWLIKTDSNGNEEWNKILGGEFWEEGCSVQQTSDGGYILAGYTNSFGAGSADAWLIKIANETENYSSPDPGTTLTIINSLGSDILVTWTMEGSKEPVFVLNIPAEGSGNVKVPSGTFDEYIFTQDTWYYAGNDTIEFNYEYTIEYYWTDSWGDQNQSLVAIPDSEAPNV